MVGPHSALHRRGTARRVAGPRCRQRRVQPEAISEKRRLNPMNQGGTLFSGPRRRVGRRRHAIGLMAVLVLVGCTLGPEAERPATVLDDAERFTQQEAASEQELPEVAGWWERF